MSKLFMALAGLSLLVIFLPLPLAYVCSGVLDYGEHCAALDWMVLATPTYLLIGSPLILLLVVLALQFRSKETGGDGNGK